MQELQRLNKKVTVPLFWKFTLGIFVVVTLFGSINILLIHRIISSLLENELQQRSLYISRTISERAIDQLLFDDVVGLNNLVNEMKSVDPTVEYVFIMDRNLDVRAHTFEDYFPAGLLNDQYLPEGDEISTVLIQPEGSINRIREFTLPLLGGRAGYARVGITEVHIGQAINRAVSILIWMVVIFFITGIMMTMAFSYMVTYPIKSISQITENIDLDTIQHKKVQTASRYPVAVEKPLSHLPADELDTLVEKFNEMINRLQHAYGELESAQKKLVQSEKMASIGSLAAGVAHEVNNPLAGLMHCLKRISKNPENCAEIVKYSGLMQEATLKIEKVMKGLLSFARQPGHSLALTELNLMIDNSILLASHKLGKKKIIISQEHKIPGVKLMINKNRIEQVLLNLLLNSIDAITEKQAEIKDFAGKIIIGSWTKGKHLFIEIRDNGSGIRPEDMEKITDPFFTTKVHGEGTGLGLPISIGIMKEHGGDLEITSVHGEGTRVKLSLPMVE
jgi:two-component system, NtrC family, sensor kinase